MKVKLPARAPTTPPDMGASTKTPDDEEDTDEATLRDVNGSIVLQSMKSRVGVEGSVGRGEARIEEKSDCTCCGSGRTLMITSFWQPDY